MFHVERHTSIPDGGRFIGDRIFRIYSFPRLYGRLR